MAQQRQQTAIAEEKRAHEYLANERTFLAWIRTSIAIISLGFVVVKFCLWLRELATRLDPQMQTSQMEISLPIGVTMVAPGGVLAVPAAWRYHVVNRAIESGLVSADRGLVILFTVKVVLLCVAMIVYMLLTAQHA